jgi:hypothetical protein
MTIYIIFYLALILFFIYLLIDLFNTGNINTFIDNWLRKSIWIWLPFAALWRLTKEVIFKQK